MIPDGQTRGIRSGKINIRGHGVYGTIKYESGTHKVIRIPETEKLGRLHSSAA